MRIEDDAVVAEVALRKGWLGPSELRRALDIQWAAAVVGLQQRLLDVLRTKGFVTDRQARELDDELGLALLARPEHARDIEGYALAEPLGQSGVGALFRGVQLSIERPVLVKVLPPELAREPSFVKRFLREARMAGQVSHPNVVCGLDSGRSGEFTYYTAELFDGRDLEDAPRTGPLPLRAVAEVARQVAEALAHTSALGILHRDIRPGNILVTPDGTVKLQRLGVARFPQDPSVVETGMPVATPQYISPERAQGQAGLDVRSDLYSLGASLYHLATGQCPFAGDSVAALFGRHVEEPVRPPIELRPDMPGPLSDLLCRMLAKSPGDRPRSPEEVVQAIDAALPQRPAQAEAPPPAEAPAAPPLPAIAAPEAEPAPLPSIAKPEAPEASAEETQAAAAPVAAAPPPAPSAEAVGEPAPAGRFWGRAAWLTIFAVLLGLLVVSGDWALKAYRRRRLAREAAQAPAEPRPTTEGSAEPAVEPDTQVDGSDAARRLVAEALEFDRDNPKAYQEAMVRLRRAAAAAAGMPGALEADARLAARGLALSGQANQAYAALGAQVRASRDADRYGDALRACVAFPAELRFGPWAESLDAELAKLVVQAEQRYLELARRGAAALPAFRLDEGLEAYRQIGALGVPWIAEAGNALAAAAARYAEEEQQRLEAVAQKRAVVARRRSFAALTAPFRRAAEAVKGYEYAGALKILQDLPEGVRQGDPGIAVARFERRIRLLLELWNAVQADPPGALGMSLTVYGRQGVVEGFDGPAGDRSVRIRIGGGGVAPPFASPIRRLPFPQIVQLAERALERPPSADRALKLGLLHVAAGMPKEARANLDEAAKLGADVAADLEEMAAQSVAEDALAACKEPDQAGALDLLRKAVDRYATTTAVIVEQPALMDALAKLGEPATVPMPKPTPLPSSLRRLTLLPATRLRAGPPADPLAACFANPLERGSPVILGLAEWKDYSLTLDWSADEPASFVLFFRLTEPKPGQFHCGYVAVDGDQAVLGRSAAGKAVSLAERRIPGLERGRHQVIVTLQGPAIDVAVDGAVRLEASDGSLASGNIGLATAAGQVLLRELAILFPAAEKP